MQPAVLGSSLDDSDDKHVGVLLLELSLKDTQFDITADGAISLASYPGTCEDDGTAEHVTINITNMKESPRNAVSCSCACCGTCI